MRTTEYEPAPVRALLEAGLTAGLLFAGIVWIPLGSRGFEWATAAACLCVFGYVAYSAIQHPAACRRWGLTPSDGDEGWVGGCLVLGTLYLASLLPITVARFFVELPHVGQPAAYFVWCAVQDFVFFALILRNLEELTHPVPAVAATAVLFGLSHYPLSGLMVLTGLVGLVWGCLYAARRGLLLITACHWIMGVILLA